MESDAPPSLPDILAPNLKVIFCGLNPSVHAAASGVPFDGRGNRFWPVLHRAGFTPSQFDPREARSLLEHGCGLTVAVRRATTSAAELSRDDYVQGSQALAAKIAALRPRFIAFLGKSAYAALSSRPDIAWGPQPTTFGGAAAWILPNPSGLNRAFNLEALVAAYRQLRMAID